MRRQRNLLGPQGMGGMVSLWGASSLIRSVQYGLTNIPGAASSATATVTAVVSENCVILDAGYQTGYITVMNPLIQSCTVVLTNSTTVTMTRESSTGQTTDFQSWVLVEFAPGVLRSRQVITPVIAATATITDTTVTQVDLTKTLLLKSFRTDAASTAVSAQICASARLTTVTNARWERSVTSSSYNMTGSIQIVEFF